MSKLVNLNLSSDKTNYCLLLFPEIMNHDLQFLLPGILFISFFIKINCQVVQKDDYNLKLEDSDRKIENTIRMYLSEWQYESLHSITSEKADVRTNILTINGDTLIPEDISTRGQTTLKFKRKSLSFHLSSDASFRHGEKADKLKKFNVVNLAMDKYLYS